ncbi:sulfite exporter TauE/SafE family protein [Pseudocolwellia agarivorans]|uniref:sulfite exporter TauE/SafE family protein n=1 Tax=Pseudocolwellia agarivorans TaxID=1911682 RepID=UPI0009847346|nr:sulfite exporter TauE/SafE family protein [Pseudocolwellia agarivorans]
MLSLFSYELSYNALLLLFLVAFFIGMAKTGVSGISMFAVPLLALNFGGKESSGIMLPLLVMADLFGVFYYHRSANWYYLKKLFPWAAIGVIIGTLIGEYVDDQIFRQLMGIILFGSLALMIWQEQNKRVNVPDYMWFAILMGLLGGITTMVGNLAGVVMALYLLSMRLPKNEFIGTAACFFLAVNLFKVPFHVFVWETITIDSFLLNIISLPFIALGAYAGVYIVKRIPNKQYRWWVIGMTVLAAVFMVL